MQGQSAGVRAEKQRSEHWGGMFDLERTARSEAEALAHYQKKRAAEGAAREVNKEVMHAG